MLSFYFCEGTYRIKSQKESAFKAKEINQNLIEIGFVTKELNKFKFI